MRIATPKQPYKIILVDYEFFLDYDSMPSNFESIRLGKKSGESVVTDIRSQQNLPTDKVNYRLNYSSEWSLLVKRTPLPDGQLVPSPSRLYNNRIPISASKFKHLKKAETSNRKRTPLFLRQLTKT